MASEKIDYKSVPDELGRFGPYGGRYVSETLIYALNQLEETYNRLSVDPEFQKDFDRSENR